MFTTVAWYKSVDPAGAFTTLNGVADQHVTVSGTDILCPTLNQIIASFACVDQTVAAQLKWRTPSLLADGFEEFIPALASGLKLANPPAIDDCHLNPVPLVPVEAIQAWVLSDPAAAAGHYAVLFLADGNIAPVKGRIRTIRCTAAITLAAGTWVNGALTFPTSLKAGNYQIVGMRAESANLVAARLVIPGFSWRPGVPGSIAQTMMDYQLFRDGNLGVWGQFYHASPPTIDCLGVTDTAEEIFLDVVYLG
jgi:hypothetical protein